MPLTDLQRQVLLIFANVDETATFALAGSGGLNVHGIVDRYTEDLDLFNVDADHVDATAGRLLEALNDAGLAAEWARRLPGFATLAVNGGETTIDLATDYRWLEPVETPLGVVLDPRELAADKMNALFGRSAPRDLVDIAALRRRYSIADMANWAAQKDAGFSIDVAIEFTIGRSHDPELAVTVAEFDEMKQSVVQDFLAVQRRSGRSPRPGRSDGLSRGLG